MIFDRNKSQSYTDKFPVLPDDDKVYITHGMFVEIRWDEIKRRPWAWDHEVYPMILNDDGVEGFLGTFSGLVKIRRR